MELKINIIEAAAELAEKRVKIEMLGEAIYEENIEGTTFTEEAQDLYNIIYDEIFTKLVDCKVTPIPNLFNSMHLFIEDAVEQLANQKVERHFKQKYKGQSKEMIAAATWTLAELNSMVYTKEAQGVFDEAKVYYEMNLKQFEV
jgi:hypothetical protein